MNAGTRIREALGRAATRSHLREAGPNVTSRADLTHWARAHLAGHQLVIVSNREPYSHHHAADAVRWVRNAGGVTVALDAVASSIGGVWIAHGSGNADRETVDRADHIACPPDRPKYTLRRLWLTEEDHDRYYAGFSNSGLWPLCHIVHVRPHFRPADWEGYRDVNRRFAMAVLDELGEGPAVVLLQDYHLALAARYIKAARPDVRVAMFWHIPWPNAEVFERLPWREELLDGLLANDVIGFHIHFHALNFLETVSRALEARVDHEHQAVHRAGSRTWVRDYPIAVDTEEIGMLADSPATREAVTAWRERLQLGEARVGLGVDRLDYTKGIPERLEALERFYERYPWQRDRFAFIQVGVPSRIELEEYRAVGDATRDRVRRINRRFARGKRPIVHLLEDNFDFRELIPLYAMADVCTVTSLHDGMNLVAKEYVAASPDLAGQLILSPFTGAAREFESAWITSPYDCDALAQTLANALAEPDERGRERMALLRQAVLRRTIFDWAIDVLDGALTLGPFPAGITADRATDNDAASGQHASDGQQGGGA
jgi:trehalose-6-phosphate synthase